MPSAEAKRKHEALLAELRQGTSWLNMYQTTAKVCEPEKPLPHNFAMPMVKVSAVVEEELAEPSELGVRPSRRALNGVARRWEFELRGPCL